MRARWLVLAALAAASPVVAQETAVLVIRAADTAWVRQEAVAGRYASVAVDGELVGRLLARDAPMAVSPGLHHVVVTMPGYAPFTDSVRAWPGARVLVTVRLERLGPVAASLAGTVDAGPLIPSGTWVRVRSTGVLTEGQVTAPGVDTLFLAGRPPLRFAAVDSLWVRRSSWKRGAVAGAVAGGLLAAALGVVATHWEANAEPNAGGTTAGMAVVGAMGGFLLGAAVGAAIPRWERRHP